jgi:hypothetical protein
MLAKVKSMFTALAAVLVFVLVGGASAFADDSSFAPRDRFFFGNAPRNFLLFDRFLFDDFDDDDEKFERDDFARDRFFFNRLDRDRFFFNRFDRDDDD